MRAGSKGVPGKNKKLLNGKPLFQWSFEILQQLNFLEGIFVSTDDQEILESCVAMGAINCAPRAPELSGDMASKFDVWKDSVSQIEKSCGAIDVMIDLDVTSPVREVSDVLGALEVFQTQEVDLVMSARIAKKNPYFNLLEFNEEGYLDVCKKIENNNIVSRQSAPVVYEHVASIYVADVNYLKKCNWIYEGKVLPFIMDDFKCTDVDDELDFELVKWIMNNEFK